MQKVAVFGLGHFGASVAAALYEAGVEVLAVDNDRGLVDEIKDHVSVAASFDATVPENLERFSVGDMDAAVIGMGSNFEAAIMITLLCREVGVPKIITKALSKRQGEVLLKVGADEVVMPEEKMGKWLAANMLHNSVVNMVELPDGYSLLRVHAKEEWCGHTLLELELLKQERLNLVQVHRNESGEDGGMEKFPLPTGDFRIEVGDELDIIGMDAHLAKLKAVTRL
jgi:trk/ktr system potassium uptake protein